MDETYKFWNIFVEHEYISIINMYIICIMYMLYMYLSDLSKYILSASLWPGAPDLGGWKLVMATLKYVGICLYPYYIAVLLLKWCVYTIYDVYV